MGFTKWRSSFFGRKQGSFYRRPSVNVYWMSILVVKMVWRKVIFLQADVPQAQPNSAPECASDRLLWSKTKQVAGFKLYWEKVWPLIQWCEKLLPNPVYLFTCSSSAGFGTSKDFALAAVVGSPRWKGSFGQPGNKQCLRALRKVCFTEGFFSHGLF